MDIPTHPQPIPELPSGSAVRRFWISWLVLLLVLLAAFVVIILIAALRAEPVSISPAG